jgi:hypothetical protein
MKKLIGIITLILLLSYTNAQADTLAIDRVTFGSVISSTATNNRSAEVEAVVNGHIDDNNLEDDAVTAAKLNSDVVRSGYGVKQHTDGSLMVDVSDTNPNLELTDGGLRVQVDNTTIERTSNGIGVKSGGLNASIINLVYPIGSIYVSTVSTNPNTLFGTGTWTDFGSGKVLVGQNGSDTDFDVAEETGGAKTHTLTISEMPAHTHTVTGGNFGNVPGGPVLFDATDSGGTPQTTSSTGGGAAHSIMNPYIVVYMFKRTA